MSRWAPTLAIGVLLVACCGWVLAQRRPSTGTEGGQPPNHDVKPGDAEELERLFKARGYSEIPLDRLRSGYLAVRVTAAGSKLRLILDTGAPVTCLDPERTKAINLKWHKLRASLPERDPEWDTSKECELDGLDFGAFKTGPVRAGEHRVAAVNQWLAVYRDPPVDGVLGGDVLTACSAWIDYPGRRLFLRPDR